LTTNRYGYKPVTTLAAVPKCICKRIPSRLGICDGTGWTLEVSYEDIEAYSDGDNSYPEDEDDDESQLFAAPPRRFERFLKAVSDLIDGCNFA
jgi:hypothetical protein